VQRRSWTDSYLNCHASTSMGAPCASWESWRRRKLEGGLETRSWRSGRMMSFQQFNEPPWCGVMSCVLHECKQRLALPCPAHCPLYDNNARVMHEERIFPVCCDGDGCPSRLKLQVVLWLLCTCGLSNKTFKKKTHILSLYVHKARGGVSGRNSKLLTERVIGICRANSMCVCSAHSSPRNTHCAARRAARTSNNVKDYQG